MSLPALGLRVAVVVCWLAAGCAAPQPGPRIAPAEPPAGVTLVTRSPTPAPVVGLGVPVTDLRQVDWDEAVLPPGVCGIDTAARLSRRRSRETSATWGAVTVWLDRVAYGDLLSDPGPEAAVRVYCDNGGGTASSILEYGLVVYSARGGELTAVGLVRPQRQDATQLPTLLLVRSWRPATLVVTELYYRSADPTCCPSGRARTTWSWASGVAEPGPPRIVR